MNNNLYNIPSNWYKDSNPLNNIINMGNDNKNNDISNPKEGFLRGNLWDSLYDPYKNYTYDKLNATSKYEELLFNLLKYKFALNELDLYLDINNNDRDVLRLYKQYLQEEKRICDSLVREYGPIMLSDENLGDNSWNWIKSPWPWEGTR